MGWQGEVKKRSERERVAAHFGVSWQVVRVWCWRDDDKYWVSWPGREAFRVLRSTLEPKPIEDQKPYLMTFVTPHGTTTRWSNE